MDKTKQTTKSKSGEKPLKVMDGLGVSFEEAMKVLSQPVKQTVFKYEDIEFVLDTSPELTERIKNKEIIKTLTSKPFSYEVNRVNHKNQVQ